MHSTSTCENSIIEFGWHETLRQCLDAHRFVLMSSDFPGAGKTTAAVDLAVSMTGNFPEIVMGSAETERSDLWGHDRLRGDETAFVDGPVPRALKSWFKRGRKARKPQYLIVEEAGQLSLETRGSLLGLRGQDWVSNPMNLGEIIEVHPDFRCILTTNREDLACRRNKGLGLAWYDDMICINCPSISEPDAHRLLSHHFPEVEPGRIERGVQTWTEYRELSAGDDDHSSGKAHLSFRALMHWMKLTERMDEDHATRIAFVNKFLPDEALFDAASLKHDYLSE